MPRFPSAQGRLNHEPGFHLSCDENLSEGWGPPLSGVILSTIITIMDHNNRPGHPLGARATPAGIGSTGPPGGASQGPGRRSRPRAKLGPSSMGSGSWGRRTPPARARGARGGLTNTDRGALGNLARSRPSVNRRPSVLSHPHVLTDRRRCRISHRGCGHQVSAPMRRVRTGADHPGDVVSAP